MGRLSESLLLLAAGAAFGPRGVGVLSADVLSFLDPAMPVALVALGALVGLAFSAYRPRGRRLMIAATAEGTMTMVAVGAGLAALGPLWASAVPVPYWFLALVLGICAGPSAGASLQPSGEPHSTAERIGDLDALLPIAVGGVALALLRTESTVAALLLVGQASAVALMIAVAAWLLMSRSSSPIEQRVFTGALLLLLGGAADYLAWSALLGGLIAGLFLDAAGGQARDAVRRDIRQLERPLIVLVLLVTGARLELPPIWLGLGVSYLLLRTAAKLLGAWTARRLAGDAAPSELGASLLSPGIVGIAFALNVLRAAGPDTAPLLAVVTVGAIGSWALGALVGPREEPE